MKKSTKLANHALVSSMALLGMVPALAETHSPRGPRCVVTERTQIEGPYSDGSESITRTSIPFRWVEGSISHGFARAEAVLQEGGRAELKLEPGYGMRFHTLTLTSAQGKTAEVRTHTPWHALFTDRSHTDWTIGYSSVSTSLELRNDTTCSPGQSIYCSIRKISAECSFNPLIYQERE